MNLESISNFVASELSNRTQFGVQVVTSTEPTFRKPKTCPFSGRVVKVAVVSNVTFADYQNKVNGQLTKRDMPSEFISAPSYAESLRGALWQIVYKHKTADTHYLKIVGTKGQIKSDVVWLLDGHTASEEELAQIKEWLPERSDSKKQAESGLTGENQVSFRYVKIENVVALTTNLEEAKRKRDAYVASQVQVQVTAK